MLEVNGPVTQDELSLSWRYCPGERSEATVGRLAASFGRELEQDMVGVPLGPCKQRFVAAASLHQFCQSSREAFMMMV